MTLRQWEDMLDWQENQGREGIGVPRIVSAVCSLLARPFLRRSLRNRAWRRDRVSRPAEAAAVPQGQSEVAAAAPEPAPPPVYAAPAAVPVPEEASDTPPAASPSGRRSVLVVDDDKTARKTITTILTKASFDVLEAGTVAEALRRLPDQPDWILLDLMLPDGSGCGVLREVSGKGSSSRVCVISGAGPTLIGEAKSLGARHVLRKPLDLPRLMSILET